MRSPSCDDHFNSEDRQNSVECEGVGSVISDGFVQWDTYTNHAHYTITDSTMFKVPVIGYSYWLLMSWCLMSAVRCFVYLLLIFFSFLINKSFYCLLAIRFTKIQKEVRRADIRSTSQNSRRHNHTIYLTKYNYRFRVMYCKWWQLQPFEFSKQWNLEWLWSCCTSLSRFLFFHGYNL